MARVVVLSFRLGGVDGVAIEARKWCDALTSLGHDVVTVAGEGDVDVAIWSAQQEAEVFKRATGQRLVVVRA